MKCSTCCIPLFLFSAPFLPPFPSSPSPPPPSPLPLRPPPSPSYQMYMLTGTCCLLDPQLVQYTAQFYITQSVWIVHYLEKCHQVCVYLSDSLLSTTSPSRQEGDTRLAVEEKQRQVMCRLPEFCVRDMAVWFRLIVLMRPVFLQGLQVIDMCTCSLH